jgi:hypothetical protein
MTRALFILLFLSSGLAEAQFMVKGELDPLWPLQRQYKENGWFFAPGLTRTFTDGVHKGRLVGENGGELEYEATPKGKTGIFLEVGRYHRLENWLYFEHWDYSLAFKQLKGRERFEAQYLGRSNGTGEQEGIGTFNSYYLSANANLNHWTQITDHGFIRASVGVNADYRVIDKSGFEGTQGFRDPAQPPRMIGQGHAKLGYGWKVSQKWFIVPTLETPLLNVYPWEGTVSSLDVFSSRYQPVTLSVRFLIRDELPPDECPPVPGGTDSKMNKDKLEKGKGGGN